MVCVRYWDHWLLYHLLNINEALQVEDDVGKISPNRAVREDQVLPRPPLVDDRGEIRAGAGLLLAVGSRPRALKNMWRTRDETVMLSPAARCFPQDSAWRQTKGLLSRVRDWAGSLV